jgi:hypothetical protein
MKDVDLIESYTFHIKSIKRYNVIKKIQALVHDLN